MQEISERTELCCLLTHLNDDYCIDVHHEVYRDETLLSYGRGCPRPVFMGSSPKVIIAHLPKQKIHDYYNRFATQLAEVNFAENAETFINKMKKIKKQGFYFSQGELDPNVSDGQMSIGMIMYHVLLFNNVSAPIRSLHRIYDEINSAMIYSESFFNILEADQEIEASGSRQPKILGKFELEHVDFTYPNGYQALHHINMTIQPNKITALVGLSGAGKSTLISLLDKFYLPNAGCIKLDGIDLEEIDTHYLREHIGLVLQKNHIFQGSILENIRYGKPQSSNEEVIQAAKKASIHVTIFKLQNAYELMLLLLSGGQQQRIRLPRMFLKNPPIIFFRIEPTGSLVAIAADRIKQSFGTKSNKDEQ
ncbi:hypothetical protein FQR65_LT16733 [Abscondita terminalis]|nr:hypothetical protein FQR65_LT16733 [Abscondita terminalis]